MIADAIMFPFQRSGWPILICGTLLSVLINILSFVPLIGFIVALFGAGYFASYYIDIVGFTMTHNDDVPDWPSLTDLWDDIITPFFRICGLIVLSFWPIIIVPFLVETESPQFTPVLIGVIALGCLYFPMAVIALQAFGTLGGAMPHVVIPAVIRAMPGYLLGVLALAMVFVGCTFAEGLTAEIPFAGWVLTAFIGLYGLMCQARLIGLIYRHYEHKIGWL
ncbi:MAG: hypothetical protein ACLFRF_01490 [Desulfobacterales bacterium]